MLQGGLQPGLFRRKTHEVQRTLLRHKHVMGAGNAAWKTKKA
jgi:hypothetical protein